LASPQGAAVDALGNLFIADTVNNRIREVGVNGIISTVAGKGVAAFSGDGGPATNASLDLPSGVAVDANGSLFIADLRNNRIRKVATNGVIATVAGNGSMGYSGDGMLATNASLDSPEAVTVDSSGNLFIADTGNARIRKVSADGIITTVAGGGNSGVVGNEATNTLLELPVGVAVDAPGDLFISEAPFGAPSHIVQVWTNGILARVVGGVVEEPFAPFGDGGPATNATVVNAGGIAVDTNGGLFIADDGHARVRKVVIDGPVLLLDNLTTNNTGVYDVIVSGSFGAVTSSVINLSVGYPPQNLSATLTAGQVVQLQWNGTPGYPYVLLSTTNLAPPVDWQPLVTNVADTNGNWSYTVTNTTVPALFYRALAP
jgi:hypothetical protein